MRLILTLHDAQEISSTAYRAFISTFHYMSDESESDFDPDTFGFGKITSEVEKMVENSWEICDPLNKVYGTTTSELIKETVKSLTEETQCPGLKFFNDITPGEDRFLITTCTAVCYWCCCDTVKKVSPIIAEATTNLIY
uniref:Uncharacterized protein n=1 Tax=Halamphora calidilacuna TaxID=2133758 RepID=A0A516ZBI0_9STRA|nr:hypothetical protein [Halamphora calidilacuna]QDR25066.1 hypothetical protein [Halamphora calidilacuna]